MDGNYDQVYTASPYCSLTNAQLNAWWLVDLQAKYLITNVIIWNEADAGDRLTPLKIEVF